MVGVDPFQCRSSESEAHFDRPQPRSGASQHISAGTIPPTGVTQEVGVYPDESGFGRVGSNTSRGSDKLREERRFR